MRRAAPAVEVREGRRHVSITVGDLPLSEPIGKAKVNNFFLHHRNGTYWSGVSPHHHFPLVQ
jgi:hypothetical protein